MVGRLYIRTAVENSITFMVPEAGLTGSLSCDRSGRAGAVGSGSPRERNKKAKVSIGSFPKYKVAINRWPFSPVIKSGAARAYVFPCRTKVDFQP